MDQTIRIDPLDHFRRYTGGYNITNKHYWSSTVFTGISGYMLAIIWLLGGTVCVAVLAVKLCPANKKRKSCLPAYSWCSFVAPVFLGAILTISVIAVSGVVISASSNFHSKAKLVRNMVLGAAEEATATIFNVTGAMKAMEEHIQIYDAKASYRLNLMHQKMEAEAESIQRAATKNQHLINKGLQILDISTTTLSALIIVFVLVSLISGLLHRPRLFCLTILICWLLTSLSWMFFGFYFSLGKFAGDTCSAIQEYKEDPHKSSLSAILPCEELSTNDMLYSTRAAIHDLIDQVNANISTVEEISSLQELQLICNPFSAPPSYQYRPGDCPADTFKIGDISHVLSYTCYSGDSNNCNQAIKAIFGTSLTTIQAYTSSIQDLIDAFPGMEGLTNCSFVNDTFSEILQDGCAPVQTSIRVVWSSLAAMSTLTVALVILWARKTYQDERQSYVVRYVTPHSKQEEFPQPVNVADGITIPEKWQVV